MLSFKQIILKKKKSKMCLLNPKTYCNTFPKSKLKIIKRNTSETSSNLQEQKAVEQNSENVKNESKEFRVNEVNIQMLSMNIYEQLFKTPSTPADPRIVKSCQENLLKHGIDYKQFTTLPDVELNLPALEGKDVVEHFQNIGEAQCAPYRLLLKTMASSKLPPLPKKWSKKAGWHKYVDNKAVPVPCPPDDSLIFDVEVLMSAGKRPTLACAVSTEAWYGWVSEPLANDKEHKRYDFVTYEDLIPLETDGLEPFGDLSRPRVIVGHNVSFDRTKVKEQYWLNKTGVRFMDTMSMHTCVSGVTSYQRTVLKAKEKEPNSNDDDWMEISSLNSLTEVHNLYCGSRIDKQTRDVFMEGTLQDVHQNFPNLMTYCANDVIATHNVLKELLPLFLERFPHPVTLAGMLELGSAYLPVNSNWLQYIDSAETVFEDLKLESRQLLSLKADEACRLMHNDAYKKDIWMWDQDWSTQTLKLKKSATKKKKTKTVNESVASDESVTNELAVKDLKSKGVTKKDFNLLSEDYIAAIEYRPEEKKFGDFKNKFVHLFDLKDALPVKRPYLAGYPAWYRKLCTKPGKDPDWTPGANNITTSMQITPKLLRLSWEGYPLHYIQSEGWGFLVPFSRVRDESETDEPLVPLEELLEACPLIEFQNAEANIEGYVLPKAVEEDLGRRAYYARKKKDELAAANRYHGLGVWSGVQLQGCCHFLRLPHKDGPKYKVGNPLAKDFLDMFSQNVLTAQGNEAEKVLAFGRMMSYWRNNRERIMGQQVVWLPAAMLPERLTTTSDVTRYGAIVPQVVVCGTLTRRASEPTWMTASNAHKERVGSELRAMVQAPPGYKFVGADVDSQELWIAALLGDSTVGICGGSAFGWAVTAGDKARHTDLHSLTAAAANVCRDHAKVINYARIYGAGQNFAERLLKQFNPTMSNSEAKSKAAKMFSSTKGRRVYRLKNKYSEGFLEDNECEPTEMSSYQAMRLAKLSGKNLDEMFEKPRWVGGTESDMFNKLEDIADSAAPRTAFLGGRLSRSLEQSRGRWGGTRLNWAVQSAAADFLHLMLVSMSHLAPTARSYLHGLTIIISPEDSLRFLDSSKTLEALFLKLEPVSVNYSDLIFIYLLDVPRNLAYILCRFCLSFHDEVRYLVSEEQQYETALALQTTNLLTRAFCSQRVGIKDLPLSVAFFTSVEVDRVLRKESDMACVTPSNPHGLERGYGIPPGESLNIFQIIEKCKINC